MNRSLVLVAAAMVAHVGIGAQQQATPRTLQLVQAVERDLRVIDKADLAGDERRKYDDAMSLAKQARRFQDTSGENEGKAAALAVAASNELVPLIRRQLQLERLMAAAGQYRSGNLTDAVRALSGMPVTYLGAPVRYIEENRDRLGVQGASLADVNDKTLAALVLLETEIAFQDRSDAAARLEFTRRLLRVVDAARLPQRFVERWYMAVAGHLQGEFLLMETMLHVEDAVRRFPNDADILAVAGMFYEMVALASVELPTRAEARRTETVQMTSGDASRSSGGAHGAGASPLIGASPTSDARYEQLAAAKKSGLSRAEECYRRTLAVDGGHAEAHLRLGRVLSLTARPDVALAELRIAGGDRDPRVHYLASMFEGAVQEGATRLDAAVTCYLEALRTCPNCLSAGVALSHAQWQSSGPELATRTLDAATGRDAKAAFDDYWWDYPLGALWQRDALLRDLRGGLR